MCLIAWSWRRHSGYPLVVLANRDERHARVCAPAHWWDVTPPVLAGRDLEAGGTWLGVDRRGRLAALTNRPGEKPAGAPSRGELSVRFLQDNRDAPQALSQLEAQALGYAGFNLLLFDGERLGFGSNREPAQLFEPGTYAMANGALDEPIPKVELLHDLLDDWARAGAAPEPERWLEKLADSSPLQGSASSALFVRGEDYGTRASTIVIFDVEGGVQFVERGFAAAGRELDTLHFDFERAP
ncbi:MAG: NRDE family protein [Gammaproteobacteria bacterium]